MLVAAGGCGHVDFHSDREGPDAGGGGVDASGPVEDGSLRDGGVADARPPCKADLASDPANCGRCGHDCLGGACNAGRCQPYVFSSANTPRGVAINGDRIYWTEVNAGKVATRPIADGGVTTAVNLLAAPAYLAVDDGGIYVSHPTPGSVTAWSHAGVSRWGVGNLYATAGLSLVGPSLYVAIQDQDIVYGLTAGDGGANGVNIGALNYPEGVANDGTSYFVASGSGILAGSLPSGAPHELVPPLVPETVFTGVTADATSVYYTIGSRGEVWSVPKQGGTPTLLAQSQSDPRGIATDATRVYWANFAGGVIMCLAK